MLGYSKLGAARAWDYDGGENQAIDPLIGSIEGIAQTPAYRGLALAVFEDLELAEYGNRLPFLTFEIQADEGSPVLGAILADASESVIECDSAALIDGYAALGSTIKAAVAPLIEHFGIDLFDEGAALRSPPDDPVLAVSEPELGSSAGPGRPSRMERTQVAARSLPATLTLSYYDASRDYQTSQMRGSIGDVLGREDNAELPGVLEAGTAKALVETELARRWSRRDQLKLCLPPSYMTLKPGTRISLPSSPLLWAVEQATIEALGVVVDLRPVPQHLASVEADAGRSLPSLDAAPAATSLALFELPNLTEQSNGSALYIAASSAGTRWRSVPVEIIAGGLTSHVRTAPRKAILGTAFNVLPPCRPSSLDLTNSIEVALVDRDQWLESCDDEALVQGANLAISGCELFQFAVAEPLGAGRFRLSRLLRARRSTEWAMTSHVAGEAFAIVEPHAFRRLDLPTSMQGATIRARARGLADADSPAIQALFGASGRTPAAGHGKPA